MQYQGGKWAASRWIAQYLTQQGRGATSYLEPFVGGASVAARVVPQMEKAILADARLDLILCWSSITKGWEPPHEVSESRYTELRNAEPSALRGFVGHCCSFGGRWFNGYARNNNGRSYAAAGKRSCLRKAVTLKPAAWACADYRTWAPRDGWLVYADPPYRGVRDHRLPFHHDTFWDTMREWRAAGAVVVVSEYSAPSDWYCLDRLVTPATMGGAGTRKQIEGLWV